MKLPATSGRYAAHQPGAVIQALARVKSRLFAGKTLANDPCGLVYQYAHV
jgi:hypothetical protein